MKTCFVNLPSGERIVRRFGCFFKSRSYLFPPLELLTLTTLAEQAGSEAELIDCVAEGLSVKELISRLSDYNPDLVLFLLSFNDEEKDLEIARVIKQSLPNTQVGCFGYSAKFLAGRLLDEVDLVISGEPEPVVKKIVNGAELSSIKGLSYKRGGEKRVDTRVSAADFENLPVSRHELLDLNKYSSPFFGKPFTTVQASRGCPFNCSFCVHPFGKQYRLRSVGSVMEELRGLKKLGVKYVRFVDDVFTLNQGWVKRLCSSMINEDLNLRWECNSRAEGVSRETAETMSGAGCERIFLGIESGSQRVLEQYCKDYDLRRVEEQISVLKNAGLTVFGWFMVNPYVEAREDFLKSISFAKNSGLDFVIVSHFNYNRGARIKKPGSKKCSMSKHEMEKFFYKKFYLRPRPLANMVGLFLRYPKQFLSNAWSMKELFTGGLKKYF